MPLVYSEGKTITTLTPPSAPLAQTARKMLAMSPVKFFMAPS
jgi:hypothetical protein